ncbi:MAG: rRNA maturation RNase YbeY [Sedimentisphaerales bacterium]|jgi:probable rRNA maturation factor
MTSAEQDQGIVVHLTENCENASVPLLVSQRLAEIVCNRFGPEETAGTRYEISIVVVDDAKIRELSDRFLNHKRITDCLSFDLSGDEEQPPAGERAARMLEIIVNGDMAARQGRLRGHSSEAELALYIVHGLLHKFGFDDATPDEAQAMHEAEDEILQQLGYGSVYNSDVSGQEQ